MKTNIVFSEEGHKYFSPSDPSEEWTSVTSLIHSFQPKKDWDRIAQGYARKHKMPVEQVKKQWADKNQRAVERGIKFHKQRELEIIDCSEINGLKIFRSEIVEGLKVAPSQKLAPGIYSELLILLNSARVCGQADLVTVNEDKTIDISDYKTNESINKNGFVNWEGVEEHMVHPLSGVPNSNYWHYTLQLNTYAYMIKKNNPGLKIGKLELLHAKFDEEQEVASVEKYMLPDMQHFVKSMIEHHKLNLNVTQNI